MSDSYAGDMSSEQVWRLLEQNPDAVLVDVRTAPEWSFVGLPDLSRISKEPVKNSWQIFPAMQVNERFVEDLQSIGWDTPILLLCRSGARSKAAALALTRAGYTQAYNIVDGFEGPHDGDKHRGSVAGWKAAGLPWIQG